MVLYYTCKDLAQLNWDALAAVSAVIACSISMYQISEERKLSNKQALFDKRTDIAVLLFELVNYSAIELPSIKRRGLTLDSPRA